MRSRLLVCVLTVGLGCASAVGAIANGEAGAGGGSASEAQYHPCPPRSHNPGGRPPCGCKAAIIVGVAAGGGCGGAIAACSGRKRDCDSPPPCPPASPN